MRKIESRHERSRCNACQKDDYIGFSKSRKTDWKKVDILFWHVMQIHFIISKSHGKAVTVNYFRSFKLQSSFLPFSASH